MAVFRLKLNRTLTDILNTCVAISRSRCRISISWGLKDAYDYVLKHVGANIPCRDIVDERVIEEVRTGIPYYEKETS